MEGIAGSPAKSSGPVVRTAIATLPTRRRIAQKAARREFFRQAQGVTAYVSADYEGLSFLAPTESDGKLFLKVQRWEFVALERAIALLRRSGEVKPGSTFVDVGAHGGTTTIPALALHGFGRAISIEPDRENLRLLRANVALNGLADRVTVIEGAASSQPGRRWFLPGGGPGERSTKGRLSDAADSALPVEAMTLDELVQRGFVDPARTGLLWLDCQKQELEALRSATSFVARGVPIVFALRSQRLAAGDVAHLLESYQHVVDLRRGADKTDRRWQPELEPVERLVELAQRSSLTDVLLFRRREAMALAS
jgi:FkbM family methyltransferase